MSTLETDWVTPADPDEPCQRCEGRENVFALKMIFDRPRFICRDCLEDAAAIAFGRTWMRR